MDEYGSFEENRSVPSLDEIIQHYQQKGLLAHEEAIRTMSERLRYIPVNVPLEDTMQNVSLLQVWPLIEKYKIFEKSITKDLTREDRDKLEQLDKKYNKLKTSEDIVKVSEHLHEQRLDIQFINPFIIPKYNAVNNVLSTRVGCEPLDEHIKHTHLSKTKIFHDMQMGGSIYVMGKPWDVGQYATFVSADGSKFSNSPYSFLQRSFICMNHKSEPIIFMDSIEGGYPYFNHLDDWRGISNTNDIITNKDNKIHEVYFAIGSIMHIAEKLDIKNIILRDSELTELGRILGVGEITVFSKEQDHWKIGLHSEKSKTGVYTHSLYRGKNKNGEGQQLRHLVLEVFPYKNPDRMLSELADQSRYITESNSGRRNPVPKTNERMDTLKALNTIISEHPLATPYVREMANVQLQSALYKLNLI